VTTAEVATLKRTELQAAAVQKFGKVAAAWTPKATNEDLRAALISGEVPAKFASNGQTDLAAAIAAAINPLLQTQLDEARVAEIVEERFTALAATLSPKATELHVKLPTGTTHVLKGRQHKHFDLVLHYTAAGDNVALVGPAGSGKTTACKAAANALGLKFYPKSVGPSTDEFQMNGFLGATGEYVAGLIREPFENGGVLLLDEMDKAHPAVLTVLNTILDNGWFLFPDGAFIERHAQFRCVAGMNTYGTGANAVYVGSNQLDGATINRFTFIDWPFDAELEEQITVDTYGDTPTIRRWIARVQEARRIADSYGIRCIFSPRQTLKGAKHLSAGRPWDEVERIILWDGVSADNRSQIERNMSRAA
jgi:hypothetical protein